MNQYHNKQVQDTAPGFLFAIFCVWAFILICRPQDIFTSLAAVRPALILGLILFLVFILRNPGPASPRYFSNSQVKLYGALVCMMIISVPFAYYRRGAFMELFTKDISAILFFFIFIKIVDSTKKLEMLLLTSSLGVGLYSTFALAQGFDYRSSNRLYFGGTFDPNDMVFFTLSFLPFNFIFLSRGNSLMKKLICLVNLVAGVVVILRTGSRGGIIGFSIVMLMLLLTKTRTIKFSYKIIFVVLCLAAVSLNASKINFERYKSIGNVGSDYNLSDEEGRISVWKTGLKLMLFHPITGVGVNCFSEAIGRDRQERGGLRRTRWQPPHNMWVQIGTETGIIGFALFGLLSFRAFRTFGRVKKRARDEKLIGISEMARVGFVGMFISGMFVSQGYSVYWAFYIALSAILWRFLDNGKETETEISPGLPR